MKIVMFLNMKLEILNYVNILEAEKFADSISAKKIIVKNGGHFSKNDGYNEFKDILDYI